MSSRTSSRSTLTTVPSRMSPSLKYLMVASIGARKASSDPRSSTATRALGAGAAGVAVALEVASMLLVMWAVAPVGYRQAVGCARGPAAGQTRMGSEEIVGAVRRPRICSLPRSNPRVQRLAYRLPREGVHALRIPYPEEW